MQCAVDGTILRGLYFTSQLYRQSGRRLSAKLVSYFPVRVSVPGIPTAVNLGFSMPG
jgi:hypothetical protein